MPTERASAARGREQRGDVFAKLESSQIEARQRALGLEKYMVPWPWLMRAMCLGDEKGVWLAIGQGEDPTLRMPATGRDQKAELNALDWAAGGDSLSVVEALIEDGRCDPDERARSPEPSRSPIEEALAGGRDEIVAALMAARRERRGPLGEERAAQLWAFARAVRLDKRLAAFRALASSGVEQTPARLADLAEAAAMSGDDKAFSEAVGRAGGARQIASWPGDAADPRSLPRRLAESGRHEALERMLAAGADLSAADLGGIFPLAAIAERRAADPAEAERARALAKKLIQAGANPAALASGLTPLLRAIAAGQPDALLAELAAGGACLARGAGGETPLGAAIRARRASAVGLLAGLGADWSQADAEGLDALDLALRDAENGAGLDFAEEMIAALPPREAKEMALELASRLMPRTRARLSAGAGVRARPRGELSGAASAEAGE
jgi:hypothetical protein